MTRPGPTGFTRAAALALTHLREAWSLADPDNRAAVEASIRALLAAHAMRDVEHASAVILRQGLDDDRALELLEHVGLLKWVLAYQVQPPVRAQ